MIYIFIFKYSYIYLSSNTLDLFSNDLNLHVSANTIVMTTFNISLWTETS